jgi:hypothetical protein
VTPERPGASPLRIEHADAANGAAQLSVRRRAARLDRPIVFEVSYGGARLVEGVIPPGELTVSVSVPELVDWMADEGIAVHAWTPPRRKCTVDATCVRGNRPTTAAERKARSVWGGFKRRDPGPRGRRNLSDRSSSFPVVIYESVGELLAHRRSVLTGARQPD